MILVIERLKKVYHMTTQNRHIYAKKNTPTLRHTLQNTLQNTLQKNTLYNVQNDFNS